MSKRLLNIFYPFNTTKQFIEGAQLSIEKYSDEYYDIRSNNISENSIQYTSYYINRYLVELLEEIRRIVEISSSEENTISVIVPEKKIDTIENAQDKITDTTWK